MELKGSKLVLVGGAGLIGSHTVDRLLKEDVSEAAHLARKLIEIYDKGDRHGSTGHRGSDF